MKKLKRKQNKKIILGLILLQFFLGIISIGVDNASSFANGSFSGYLRKNIPYWDIGTPSGRDWYGNNYGTHDWIGDGALDAVELYNNWLINGKKFWTPRRKWIFLVGTEAPDAPYDDLLIELDDSYQRGMKTTVMFHFYTRTTGYLRMAPKDNDFRRTGAELVRLTYLVIYALEDGKCDTAAFFMGALCHLFGDFATFTHISEESANKDYESHILTHTKDYQNREKVFKYPNTYDFTSIRTPPELGLEIAFYTMWGKHAEFWWIMERPIADWIEPGYYTADECVEELNKAPTYQGFKGYSPYLQSAVRHHLKEAVRKSAMMINWFKPFWDGDCLDDDDDQGGDSDYPGNSPPDGGNSNLQNMITMLMFMIAIGISNVLSIPIVQLIFALEGPATPL